MKTIRFFWLILCIFAIFTVFGCKTPQPVVKVEKEVVERIVIREVAVEVEGPPETMMPLTPSILQRLRDYDDQTDISERIRMYQFRLFGRISLDREFVDFNDGPDDGGGVRFENLYIRDNIIIRDQTDGQAIAIRSTRNETALQLCFEDDSRLQLVFYADGNDPDGFFYLDYTPTAGNGDEKGTLVYGGDTYKVKFSDRRPYILIKLSQKFTDQVNSRTAMGRKVD